MSFTRYQAYKHCGVEWLGEVPAHWEVMPVKYAGEALIGLTYSPDDVTDGEGTLVLRSSNIQNGRISLDDCVYVSTPIPDRLRTRENDILICSRNGSRALIGKNARIGPSVAGATFGAFMTIFRSAANDFLYWVFNSSVFEFQSSTFLTATINQLTVGNLNSFEIPLAPSAERAVISNFLDHETAKIDALVEEQQRLIALLKEKRQAVISHAVTKGLDPDTTMKDGGVEWLGEVPAHWEIDKFSRLIEIAEGQVDPRIEPFASMLLIAPNHVESETGRLLAQETAVEQGADSGKYQFEAGVVVYSKIRPSLAKAVIAPLRGLCSADMYPLKSRGKLRHGYLLLLLLTPGFTAWASLESDRVAMPKINREKLSELRLPVPSQSEQARIETYVAEKVEAFDALIAAGEHSVALLQERRSALISAVVTGKIDVSDLVSVEAEAA